jgi:hypothetical protein
MRWQRAVAQIAGILRLQVSHKRVLVLRLLNQMKKGGPDLVVWPVHQRSPELIDHVVLKAFDQI